MIKPGETGEQSRVKTSDESKNVNSVAPLNFKHL